VVRDCSAASGEVARDSKAGCGNGNSCVDSDCRRPS
jgi:hypothetical protein